MGTKVMRGGKMPRFRNRNIMLFPMVLILLNQLLAANATAITRDVVVSTAHQYSINYWYCTSSNANSTYNDFIAGTTYSGVPYNWGGYDTLSQFQSKINGGFVAGNSKERCGDYLCSHPDFAGVDCSGYVSRAWGTGHYTTRTLPGISTAVSWNNLRRGDVLNKEGSHVALFYSWSDTFKTKMWVYEATTAVNPDKVVYREISKTTVDTYTPRRYNGIQEWLGDLNWDGYVTVLDVVKIRQIVMGWVPYQACSDMNGDGWLSVLDVVKAKGMSIGSLSLVVCND